MWDLPDKNEPLQEIIDDDPRFTYEAYSFILDTLREVIESLKEVRHISGQELSEGCRRRALELYGPMARSVLEYWGIKTTSDFGEIVFNLIKAKQLTKTETDNKKDFRDVFDFEEAFDKQYPWGKVS
jgi:uncharacterized repeat protein (TIGR04138 family)